MNEPQLRNLAEFLSDLYENVLPDYDEGSERCKWTPPEPYVGGVAGVMVNGMNVVVIDGTGNGVNVELWQDETGDLAVVEIGDSWKGDE